MVCVGRKAQVLALRGMDIRRGNHPSNRRAFSAMLTSVAYTSPNPGRRSVWTSSSQLRSFTWCRLFSTPQWLRNTRSSSLGPHRRELTSADTSAPGSPPRCRCPPSPSPPSLPASPREIPTHPGYTQPAHHQSRRFSITAAFFRQSLPPALPVPPGQTRRPLPPVPRYWFPLIRTR